MSRAPAHGPVRGDIHHDLHDDTIPARRKGTAGIDFSAADAIWPFFWGPSGPLLQNSTSGPTGTIPVGLMWRWLS
jgi:hypothetical protein